MAGKRSESTGLRPVKRKTAPRKTRGKAEQTAAEASNVSAPAGAWPLEERLRDLRRIFSTPFTEVEGTDLHQGIGRYGAVMPCKLKALELYSRLVGDLKGRTAAGAYGAANEAACDEEGDELTRLLEGIIS